MSEDIKNRIINVLKQEKIGACINEIARKVGVSRITARFYLKDLEKDGLVKFKIVGKAKMYYLSK